MVAEIGRKWRKIWDKTFFLRTLKIIKLRDYQSDNQNFRKYIFIFEKNRMVLFFSLDV